MRSNISRSRKKTIALSILGLIVAILIAGKISGTFDTFNKDHLFGYSNGMGG